MYTHELDDPACVLESTQPFEGAPRVAVLASEDANPVATTYAEGFGRELGKAGAIIVSGVASTAERRALAGMHAVGGKPWLIDTLEKPDADVRSLIREVERGHGSHIRAKIANEQHGRRMAHPIACALANVIVVMHSSSHRCSSLRTAKKAFLASKKVWVVPPSPWMERAEGSLLLVRRPGIRPLWRTRDLLASLGLAKAAPLVRREDPFEQRIVDVLKVPLFKDQIIQQTQLNFAQLSTAIFNLLIDGVIREGLDGRFEINV